MLVFERAAERLCRGAVQMEKAGCCSLGWLRMELTWLDPIDKGGSFMTDVFSFEPGSA